jgi:hypothetical protein
MTKVTLTQATTAQELTVTTRDNELVVDSRLIAQRLGLQHESLVKTIRKYSARIQALGHLRFDVGTARNSVGAINHTNFVYLNESQSKLVLSLSRKGISAEGVDDLCSIGWAWARDCKHRAHGDRSRAREADYSNAIAIEEQGKREVPTLAGNIDVLTSGQVIEVKSVKQWKSAVGQVLVYGYYYPSHQKRVHLYGEAQESFLSMVEGHCARLGVVMTWEF